LQRWLGGHEAREKAEEETVKEPAAALRTTAAAPSDEEEKKMGKKGRRRREKGKKGEDNNQSPEFLGLHRGGLWTNSSSSSFALLHVAGVRNDGRGKMRTTTSWI
jgi:hypothetical protein